MFYFTPSRLMHSRKEVENKHIHQKDMPEFKESEYLENLIVGLVATKARYLKTKALTLTNDDVLKVAGYLPHNYYGVDMSNLFQVYRLRANEESAEALYTQWQDRYDNKECNSFIQELLDEDIHFQDIIKELPINGTTYSEILQSDDIVAEYTSLLREKKFEVIESLAERVKEIGISSSSRIFYELEILFYTYCSKEDYLGITKDQLLDVIRKYGKEALSSFLGNFLGKFSLKELQEYYKIATHLSNVLGDVTEKKCRSYFERLSESIYVKYRDWINTMTINQAFGNDKRSIFWKKFRCISVKNIPKSQSVIIEYENFYVTEFLGNGAMGPMYFYKKDIFNKDFREWYSEYKNSKLRHEVFELWNRQEKGIIPKKFIWHRAKHPEGWENDTEWFLINNNITEKIL